MKRRKFISIGLCSSVGFGLNPLQANNQFTTSRRTMDPIDPTNPWEAQSEKDVIRLLYGKNVILIQSDKVKIKAPTYAENSNSVPLRIKSDIDAKRVIIIQNVNYSSLTGIFELPEDSLVDYSLRIKLMPSSAVILTVLVEDRKNNIYYNKFSLQTPSTGGCGG